MRFLAALAVALMSSAYSPCAFADDSPATVSATAPQPLLMANRGNNCASNYYPTVAVRQNEEGSTTVAIHIDDAGKPTAVDVVQSSGFSELDEASRNCVMDRWHFSPATMNGKPVASTKQYRIVWKLRGNTSQPRLLTPLEVACADIFADAKPRWTTYQTTSLQFRISATGAVLFPFVANSSGDVLFDTKAVQCATKLKYSAAIIDDVPIEMSWNAAVRWSPRTGLAYTDPYRGAPYCADDQFPPDLWKGDPPNGTVISFRIVQGGVVAGAAIEQSSGNPALDQAALKCVQSWRNPFVTLVATSPDIADVVRFTWRQGHAFPLSDTWK